MMTSSNGNISALLVLCAVNSPVTGEFPSHGPVTRSFDVFFHPRLNKRLSKQSCNAYLVSTVGTAGPVLKHQGISSHSAEYALMHLQMFMS